MSHMNKVVPEGGQEKGISARADSPRRRRYSAFIRGELFPLGTCALVIAQTIFFVFNCRKLTKAQCLNPTELNFSEYFSPWMSWTTGCRGNSQRAQLWRYGSSAMSHFGFSHLFSNCVVTLILGSDMEIFHGTLDTIGVWIFGHFIGLWTFTSVHNLFGGGDSIARGVGSSAAVYGLIACRLANIVKNFDTMPSKEKYFRLLVVIAFFAGDAAGFFVSRLTTLAYAAHWGGAAGGLLAGFLFFENYLVRQLESRLTRLAVFFLTLYSLTVLLATYLSRPPPCASSS